MTHSKWSVRILIVAQMMFTEGRSHPTAINDGSRLRGLRKKAILALSFNNDDFLHCLPRMPRLVVPSKKHS